MVGVLDGLSLSGKAEEFIFILFILSRIVNHREILNENHWFEGCTFNIVNWYRTFKKISDVIQFS